MRRGLFVLMALLGLAACGSTTTKTVTRSVLPALTSTAAQPTTSTPTTVSTSTAATTATTSAGPTDTVYFQAAEVHPQQRPRTLELTGDGTLFVSGVQWTSWGGATATGSGNAQYHGCTPNCAQAPSHTALVSIRLSSIRVCGGRHYYSGAALILNSGQPLDKEFMQRSWSPC